MNYLVNEIAKFINFNDEYITQYSIDSLLDYLFSPQCMSYLLMEIITTEKPKYF